jgi:hypothetical protein
MFPSPPLLISAVGEADVADSGVPIPATELTVDVIPVTAVARRCCAAAGCDEKSG